MSFSQTKRISIGLTLLVATMISPAHSRAEKTFAERLGWKASDVVVILHVDDVGMSHSSNLGAIESLENGIITLQEVATPFSNDSMAPRFEECDMPTSSTCKMTTTSVGFQPKRSAKVFSARE